jgi:hypothetical protein
MILGHMIQGDWITDDGTSTVPVTVYFDLLRTWDSRAVWWKMENDPKALEATIRFAQNRRAKAMFTFGEPPASAIRPGYRKVPTLDAWTSFVDQVVATPGVDILEGWNEPMYPQYWDGTPELLVLLQKVLYQRSRGKLVLSPSFVRVELPDGQAFLKRFIDAGGLDFCDGVAWHGYATQADDLAGQIAALRALVGTKPLWNTEYVVGPVTAAQRPKAMVDSMMLQASLGVECAVWNAEIPGSEDYTDPMMREIHDRLVATPAQGCASHLPKWLRR